MQTLTFSIRATISPVLISNHVAPETRPIWSVVETRTEVNSGESSTTEHVIECEVEADKAYALLVDLLNETVAGRSDFDRVVEEWRRANRGVAIGARKARRVATN